MYTMRLVFIRFKSSQSTILVKPEIFQINVFISFIALFHKYCSFDFFTLSFYSLLSFAPLLVINNSTNDTSIFNINFIHSAAKYAKIGLIDRLDTPIL